MDDTKETTGTLRYVFTKRLGDSPRFDWYECDDCETLFRTEGGQMRCNGHVISVCPWCRPDSEPWKNGRGE